MVIWNMILSFHFFIVPPVKLTQFQTKYCHLVVNGGTTPKINGWENKIQLRTAQNL